MWPLFLGIRPFNWTWSPWTKSKWTFMNIALWWNIQYLRLVWLHKFIVQISLPFPADQQQKQTEIAICSQNSVWNLEFAIDFWCLQLTFDVFNWVYSKHMIHYNKVNWKNFSKKFLKIFPIDFQSPIDFSQLHMIRPLILNSWKKKRRNISYDKKQPCWLIYYIYWKSIKSFIQKPDSQLARRNIK